MKNLKILKITLALLIGTSITMTSCDEKDEPIVNPHNDAFGDVFVKKVKMPDGNGGFADKYGLTFYAGGEGLKSCKVTYPDGTTEKTLAEYWKGAGNLRRHPSMNPADGEMKPAMPASGEYIFTLIFNDGETKIIKDALSDIQINAMTGLIATYNKENGEISLEWNAIESVDGYMVKFTDEQKNSSKPIFVNKLPASKTSYTFDKTTQGNPGWMQQGVPTDGQITYVFVVGIKAEAGATGNTKEQNRQCMTAAGKKIIW